MMTVRAGTFALAATAALAMSASAGAQTKPWPKPEDLAKAFQAICVDHAGDLAAQAKAAQAAPWNMKRGDASDARVTYYAAFPWQVSLTTTEKGLKICAVTVGQEPSVTSADASRAAIAVLGPRPGDIEAIDDGFYWEHMIAGRKYTMMYQGKVYEQPSNLMIASYGLSWE